MSSEQDNGATPPPTGGGNQNKNNPGGEKGKPKGGKGKGKGKGNGGGKKKETFKGVATHSALTGVVVTHNNHKEGTVGFCKSLSAFCYEKNHPEWAAMLTKVPIEPFDEETITTHEWDDSTPKKKSLSEHYAKIESAKVVAEEQFGKSLFGIVMGQVNDVVKSELKRAHEWNDIEKRHDIVALLNLLRTVCMIGQFGATQDRPLTIINNLTTVLNFKQRGNEDASLFSERLSQRYDVVTSLCGSMPFGEKLMEPIIADNGLTFAQYFSGDEQYEEAVKKCKDEYKELYISRLIVKNS